MRWIGVLIFGTFLIIGFSISRCGGDPDLIDTVACPIAPAVSKIEVAEKYFNKKVQLKTGLYYRAHQYRRAWLKKRRPDKIFNAFVQEVKASSRYGFAAEDYHIAELEQAVKEVYDNKKRTNADISNLDIRITASFFLFTTHLIEGRVRYAGAKEFLWKRGMPLENDIALLLEMENESDLRKELDDLHPKNPQYKKLQVALQAYRELEKVDTIPPITGRIRVDPGGSHEHIPLVRRKLQLTDYSGAVPETPEVYDEALIKAVMQFQERHGLDPNGKLDAETVRLLNVPIKEKIELIALNLERLRWRPHPTGDRDEIIINVPEYMMRVYHNNQEKMRMRVVIGSAFTPTPVFHDTLKYIVFSPTWLVPNSIFGKEFLPRLQENSAYYPSNRFRFFKDGKEIDPILELWNEEDLDTTAFRVVENPGDENSLGKVKFIMPNSYSIYLHDTPADQLFKREERALSHGCIRLEKPADFALYLLQDYKEWNEKKIKEAMASDTPVKVDLKKPYPVYIVYRTVWVEDKDLIHFRDDIYGHDKRHRAFLAVNK